MMDKSLPFFVEALPLAAPFRVRQAGICFEGAKERNHEIWMKKQMDDQSNFAAVITQISMFCFTGVGDIRKNDMGSLLQNDPKKLP